MKDNHHDSAVSGPKRQALLPEITRLAGEGLSSREIAEKLGIGPGYARHRAGLRITGMG